MSKYGVEFLQSLYTVIEQQIDDVDLDVNQLALSVAMSSRTLNRKLAILLNMTANELIRSYRLQRACEMLIAGLSPTETAYRVGFGNPPYFSRVFREKYQISPSEFIQQQRLSENQPDLSKN